MNTRQIAVITLTLLTLTLGGFAQVGATGASNAGAGSASNGSASNGGASQGEQPASQPILPKVGMDKLMERANAVVEGRVVYKKARWVNGNIETDYVVDVTKDHLGDLGQTRGALELTVLGGESDILPIGQMIKGQPNMAEGEEVLLFLDTDVEARQARLAARGIDNSARISPKSKLPQSPRIVSGAKGKFSIITLPQGQRYMTRYQPVGAPNNDTSYQLMREYQVGRLLAKKESSDDAVGEASRVASDVEVSKRPRVTASGLSLPAVDPEVQAAVEKGFGSNFKAVGSVKDPISPTAVAPQKSAADSAKQERAEEERRSAKLIPYNQDALAVPVPYETFMAELNRALEAKK